MVINDNIMSCFLYTSKQSLDFKIYFISGIDSEVFYLI